MPTAIANWASAASTWANENQGVISVAIFLLTLAFGWFSGIFASLRRAPKFRLALIPGPTFCTTFLTGKKHNGFEVHRSAIALYLRVTNVGSAAASIENVSVGYHWHVHPFSWTWLRFRIFWHWIDHPAVTMDDFQHPIGDKIKVYPSLLQGSAILGNSPETFLEVGRSVIGIVYFEEADSWGGCFPTPMAGRTRVKLAVKDSFGKTHKHSFWIPVVSLEQAREYNPSFGSTLATLRRDSEREQLDA